MVQRRFWGLLRTRCNQPQQGLRYTLTPPPSLQEGSSQHPDRSSGEGGNDSNSRSASRQRANRRYDLTGETGSYRYMAPEVFRHEPYNSKARGLLPPLSTLVINAHALISSWTKLA